MDAPIGWQLSRCHRPKFPSVLPAGFPVLSDANSDLICEPQVIFLYETYVRAKINYDDKRYSITNLANDLKTWFVYLEHVKTDWIDVTQSHVAGYIHAMAITIAPQTGKYHSEPTMRRRLSTVSVFYRWAADIELSKWDRANNQLLLQRAKDTPGCAYFPAIDCTSKQEVHRIKGLLNDEAKALFKQLGERPSELEERWKEYRDGKTPNMPPTSKDRLAAEMALNAGLRIFECTGLPLKAVQKYIENIENIQDTKMYPVLIKGKGANTLPTNFSGALIKQIAAYVRTERECCSPKAKTILVNPPQYGPLLQGRNCTPRTLQKRFSEACFAIGLTREEDYFAPAEDGRYEAEPRTRICAKYVFHDLRHTFAFWTYLSRKTTDAEPWKYVSEQLRHADVDTTMEIYLKHISAYEAQLSDDFIRNLQRHRSGHTAAAGLSDGA